ncbi:hypothetical protein lerEdw1_010808 [Lerista edwardsae]|nr:hypothetical protein lerEdw1_010808 [Lerista edwardsae]
MEPPGGLEALQGTLRLLLGLLALCLALLCLLNWRLAWPRGAGGRMRSQAPPASPPLLQVLPSGAAARPGERGVVAAKPLQAPAAGLSAPPLPGGAAGQGSRREPLGPGPPFCSQGSGFRSDLDQHPVLVPPNSPVTTAGSRGVLGQGFSSCHTSTQSRPCSCGRTAWPSRLHAAPAFEYGSSIQRHTERTGLNSANFTASQGPGLDSNFGASAGISVCILSSDSEESPPAAQPLPPPLGQFEWDYYDPGYKRRTRLPQQLPQICSKQYWL